MSIKKTVPPLTPPRQGGEHIPATQSEAPHILGGDEGGIMTFNHPKFKDLRQKLRNNAAKPEILLWKGLQHKRLDGYKFRRQYGVGNYILDFYCPVVRLAVEIDGESHNSEDAQEYDTMRTAYLNGFNIIVIRFRNEDILNDPDGVLEQIRKEIASLSSNTKNNKQ